MLVENFFNTLMFTGHTVTGQEEATGKEAFRVGDGRRDAADHWTPTTANVDRWVKVDCAIARPANGIFLDRGHNLDGETIVLARSPDDAVWTTVFTATLPTAAASGGDFDAANGIKTDEGAWAKRFASENFRYWRLTVNAMGAGLKPQIVGLWLGTTWEPGQFERPLVDENTEIMGNRTETELGWLGTTQRVRRRTGQIGLKLDDTTKEAAALSAMALFDKHPMWIVFNADETERVVLADRPPNPVGFQKAVDWFPRSATIPWVEREPKIT